MEINKQLVTERFAAALNHYDTEATPQQEIAQQLTSLWQQSIKARTAPYKVLEIGCGTGFFSKLLQQTLPHNSHLSMIDLCPEVEPLLREKVGHTPHFIAGDAEEITWGTPDYDLIASASCIQWWHNPANFFTKAYKYCKSNGTLLFSTFGPENMYQIRRVFGVGLHYAPLSEVRKALSNAGWRIEALQEYRTTLYRPSLLELLSHIKRTGVNGLPLATPLTPQGLKRYDSIYRSLFAPANQELPLTYHALLCIAHKS